MKKGSRTRPPTDIAHSRMEVTLIESIDNHAAKEHSNRSAMIAHACRYYLEREATK